MSHLAHGVRRSSLDFFLLGLSFFPSLFRAHADKINPNLLGLLESYVHLSIARYACVCVCVRVCVCVHCTSKHTLFFACGSSSSSSSAHSNKNKQAQKNKGEAKKKDSTVMVLLRGVVEYMQAVAVTSKTPFSSSSGADASGAILTSTPAHTNTHTTETATQSGFGMHLASSSPSLSTYALSMRGVLVHRLPATLSLAHTQAQDMYISEFASKQWQAYVDKTSVKRAPKHQKHMRNHKQSHKTGNQSTIHTFTKMSMAHFSVQSVSYLLNMWQEAEPSMDLFNRSQASHSSYRNDERVGCMQRVLRALMLAFASLKAEVAREAQHTLGSEEAVSARLMNTYARHVHDHIAVCLPLHSSSSRGLDHQKLEELNQQMCELLGLFQHTPFFEQLAQAGRGQQVTSYLTQGLAKFDGYQHVTLPLLAQLLRLVAKHPGEGLKAAFHSYFTTQTLAQTPEKVALCLEAMVHMLEAENARTHVHAEHDAYAATWFASCVAHLSGLATVTPSHQHALARLLLRVLELCMPRIHQQQGGGVLRQLVLCVFDCTRGGNPLDTSVPGPVCTVLGASDQRRAFTLLANTREWSTELLRACVFAVRSNTLSLPVKQYVVRLLGHNESKCPPSTSNVWLSSLVSCLSSTDSYIASPALADEVVCALKQGEQVVQWGALCDGLEKNKQHAVAALIRTATQ
jgi:hypothetical protein